MKLEAVIVCINYSDFLEVTLSANKKFFDRIVVVTSIEDTETEKVCKSNDVLCIKTDSFYKNGSKVANKAEGINEGLKALDKDGWVIQLDADIWLPPLTRTILEKYPLQDDCIYGIDRLMCNSFEKWEMFMWNNVKKPIHSEWIFLHMHYFPIGGRVVQYHGEGYMPIGFFQLWNPSGSKIDSYPVIDVGFDRTDVLHLKQFPRDKRRFIPEFICIHLSSEEPFMGQNWYGRKSKPFLPKKKNEVNNKLVHYITEAVDKLKRIITKTKKYNCD
jgi:hypothetical protein